MAAKPPTLTLRRTKGIVTSDGDPELEADVTMTAAALGLAASYIVDTKQPIQFDMDPLKRPMILRKRNTSQPPSARWMSSRRLPDEERHSPQPCPCRH